jgi:hypothetical protein
LAHIQKGALAHIPDLALLSGASLPAMPLHARGLADIKAEIETAIKARRLRAAS